MSSRSPPVKKLCQRLNLGSPALDWITPSLIVCAYPHDEEEIAALASQRVSLLINLHTRPHRGEHLTRHGMTEVHLPTRDFTAPKIADITSGIAALEHAFAQGRRAVVHCGAGLGRTGTFVACHLVHTGMTAEAAIEALRRVRPGSVETSGQEALVREYHGIKSRRTP